MPFDPSLPAPHSLAQSAVLRDQFNSLKALIDGQTAQIDALTLQIAAVLAQVTALQATQVPIGGVLAWFQDTAGVPALPGNFAPCNGQFLSDPASPLDGQLMPDLNTGIQRFIRGGLVSGVTGGIDTFATAPADNAGVGPTFNAVTTDYSPGAVPIPPFMSAVYVIRVK